MKNNKNILFHAVYLALVVIYVATVWVFMRLAANNSAETDEALGIVFALIFVMVFLIVLNAPFILLNLITSIALIVKYAKKKTPKKFIIFDVICKILLALSVIFFEFFCFSIFQEVSMIYAIIYTVVNVIFLTFTVVVIIFDFEQRKINAN